MQRIFIILFGLTFLSSCIQNQSEVPSISESLKTISNDTVRISQLNPLRDTVIVGEKGYRIQIPQKAFKDSEGNVIESTVEVSIEEVPESDWLSMIKSNLSTNTNTGILETRGMMNISAYSDGKALELAEGKNIEVSIPSEMEKTEETELFYGQEREDGTIEWVPAEEGRVEKSKEEKFSVSITIRSELFEDMENMNTNISGSLNRELVDSLLVFTDVEKEDLLGEEIRIYYLIFPDGDFEVYQVEGPISRRKKQEIARVLDAMPKLKPIKREGQPAEIKGRISLFFMENPSYNEAIPAYNLALIDQMGWINCDIFIRFESPKIDVKLEAAENTEVRMKFLKYATLITPYITKDGVSFKNIPKDEPILLLSIEPQGDKFKYCEIETTVSEGLTLPSNCEELSLEELGKKIKLL